MTTRPLRLSLGSLLLAAVSTACGCQQGTGNLVSGVLSKPGEVASSVVSRTRSLASARRAARPVADTKKPPDPVVTEAHYAGVQLAMGQSFERDGNLESAEAAYEAALRNDPSLAKAHHRLALVKEKRGAGAESLAHFQSALKLEPANAQLHCDLGYWYYLRRNWESAEQHLRRATELDPRLARAHNNLGLVLARTDRSDAAMQHFARAGLNAGQAHTNLGFAHLTDQRFAEAKAELDRAMAADPESRGARTLMASLSNVASKTASQMAEVGPTATTEPGTRTTSPAVTRSDTRATRSTPPQKRTGKFHPPALSRGADDADLFDSFADIRAPVKNLDRPPLIRLAQFDRDKEVPVRSARIKAMPSPLDDGRAPNVAAAEREPLASVAASSAALSTPVNTPDRAEASRHDEAPVVFGSAFGSNPDAVR